MGFGRIGLISVLGVMAIGGIARAETPLEAVQSQWGILDTYCEKCHNYTKWTGGIAFDTMQPTDVGGDAAIWEKAITRLGSHLMPPPGNPQPDNATRANFVTALEDAIDLAAKNKVTPGTVGPHRLNRTEYVNAIKDILGLDVDGESLLPKEVESDGFTNIAAVLKVSPSFIDQYITAADILTTEAVGDPQAKTDRVVFEQPETANQTRHIDGLPFGTRGGLVREYNFSADGDYVFNLYGITGQTYIWGLEYPSTVLLLLDGKEIFRADVGGEEDMKTADQGLQDAIFKINERFLNIRRRVTAGPHQVGVTFIEQSRAESDDMLHSFTPDAGVPRLSRVDRVEILGPYDPTGVGDTPSRRMIFVCHPAKADEELPCARKIFSTIARKAYRRAVTKDDLAAPLARFEVGREQGGFDNGIQQGLMVILASPKFLYRIIVPPKGAAPGTIFSLNDWELASRLAFFLWSRPPDDELLSLAETRKLHEPAVLQAQVRRMLASPNAQSLVTSFAFQWLNVGNLDVVTPDPNIFPDFDDDLRTAFKTEFKLFLSSVLLGDHSVTDLLSADYTFVNGRLAENYGIKSIKGARFQRVVLTDSARYGLLGKGAFLMGTSYGDRTSPVVRGAYVLDRIVGSPPSPPPANVEAFPENKPGGVAKTVRDRLAMHREDPSCNACHGVMDPIGLSLENFNAIGKWRDKDRYAGTMIDASGTMADGTSLSGVDDLRHALLAQPDRFVETFTEKLMIFALGRGLEYYDMPTVRRIVHEAAKDNYRFSALVEGIVMSDAFCKQQVPEGGATKEAALHQ